MAQNLFDIQWNEVNRPCALCGNSYSSVKHIFNFSVLPRPFELRECNGCGLLFNSPRIADLELLYTETYYVFQESEIERYNRAFAQMRRHLDPKLGLHGKPLHILEVGSAMGHLIHILQDFGHKAKGIELSASASERAVNHFGADVFNGSIEQYVSEITYGKMQYDVVWCNDVLEHVPDPVRFVKSCAKILKPGGRLILDTPNGGAQAVREEKPNWIGYNPYHIYLFSPENIELLLDKAGLGIHVKFTYDNNASAGLSHRQPFRSFIRDTLKKAGLLDYLKRIRQLHSRNQDGELVEQPMKSGEIRRRIEEISWFSDSNDARGELSKGLIGNNLAVHAIAH